MSNSQWEARGRGDGNQDLLAFWAPFLLLHLGGPDTITAVVLEDNALWLRHMFGLVFQVIATVYVFIQSFPTNKLWPSTILLFIAGIIKYAERTRGLFGASLDNFRESMIKKPDPGPNYAKLMEQFSSKKAANLPVFVELRRKEYRTVTYFAEPGEMEDYIAVVQHAHHFYQIFKGLIVDLIFTLRERFESRMFFHDRTAEEAFKLIAIELNFMYEALFTKAVVVHSKLGCFLRLISFSAVSIALVLFYKLGKKDFHKFDVGITYTLLFGALVLDSIAVFRLLFSEWTVAAMKKKSWRKSRVAKVLAKYLNFRRSSWSTENTSWSEWTRQLLFRRWSESVSTFNLIDYILKERRKVSPNSFDYLGYAYIWIIDHFSLKDLRDKIKYKSSTRLTKELWEFIFEELKSKSMFEDDPETAKRISSTRGGWILQNSEWNSTELSFLFSSIIDVNYGTSLLLWHVATEICYNLDGNDSDRCKFSKTVSDYMMYLLIMQPTLTSSVAGIGQMRLRDTCAEAKRFFSGEELDTITENVDACKRILEVNTDVQPAAVKGDRSNSVLFDAGILAKELRKMDKKWDLMSRVWVDLLSYTAGHCRANDHAQLLSKGGELITFVWLLMAHFGIAGQFQIYEGPVTTKLIVGK